MKGYANSPPKCFVCEKHHWASEECPHVDDTDSVSGDIRQEATQDASEVFVAPGSSPCPECGATAQTFADAARWDRIRKQQKLRMQRKRRGQPVS